MRLAGLLLALLVTAAALLTGKVSVWVDEAGHTYLTDRDAPPAPDALRLDPATLTLVWDGQVLGEPLTQPAETSGPEDRYLRQVRAARDDLGRGELQHALGALRRLHRAHPSRPEAPWLLAQVERSRGRLVPARTALIALRHAVAPLDDRWRDAAERMLRDVDEELELARVPSGAPSPRLAHSSAHFYLQYDHDFAGRAYGERVTEVLEEARAHVSGLLGRTLGRPLEVFIYTRGHYLSAYEHKFGFATVGFYDGAIHAVSSRQPERALRALLVHEYAHAVFEEALGSHRPFFLNEGIADREEERVRGRDRLSRSEWWRLVDALRADEWIPLVELVPGFGALKGPRALRAYLESRATIELLESRDPGVIARWLRRCAEGEGWEHALASETGLDLIDLDAALRDEVRSRFPSDPILEG